MTSLQRVFSTLALAAGISGLVPSAFADGDLASAQGVVVSARPGRDGTAPRVGASCYLHVFQGSVYYGDKDFHAELSTDGFAGMRGEIRKPWNAERHDFTSGEGKLDYNDYDSNGRIYGSVGSIRWNLNKGTATYSVREGALFPTARGLEYECRF